MKCEIVDGYMDGDYADFAPTEHTDNEPNATLVIHGGDKLSGFEGWWDRLDLHGAEASEDSIKSACVAAWLAARGGE